MPKDRNASEFFDRVFGVIADGQTKREPIKLKVCTSQANYIRDLKLQEAEERNEEYSIFSYYLRPTYDFQQELLWHGEDVVALESVLHGEPCLNWKITSCTRSLLLADINWITTTMRWPMQKPVPGLPEKSCKETNDLCIIDLYDILRYAPCSIQTIKWKSPMSLTVYK